MTNNHAIVVGGTRGLGRGLVELWAEGQSPVSVISRNLPASPLDAEQVRYFAADITSLESLEQTLDQILVERGPVSRLVLSQRYRGTGDTFDGEIDVSLRGTRRVIESLIARNGMTTGASIVVVSSVLAEFIAAEQPLGYHVTRAALNQMVRFYAVQLAARGIRVNAVAPNLIEKDEGRAYYLQNPQLKSHYEQVIPLGQMGTCRDVADAIDFLCSNRAQHITGQILAIDGGLTAVMQHALGVRPTL